MRKKKTPVVAKPDGIRAAIYLRVSTEEQAKSGLGIAAQRDRANMVLSMKDWLFAGEYADEGVSGAKDFRERPGSKRLLADCEAGKIDAVIFLSLDRLGRKARIILNIVEDFRNMRIQLVSCKENIDTTTAQGQLVLTVFAAMAQLERDLASERTKAALIEAGKRTGDKGGGVPYGYRRVAGGLAIIEAEAEVIRQIFLWRANGASLREVAFCLQDRGVPPRGGEKWHHSAIQCIIANEAAYRGSQRDKSENYWPPILGNDIPGMLRKSA